MSSVAEPFQRDELHLFLAVVLHLAVGLIIYAVVVMADRKPHAVMLEGLPIVFGKMITPGDNDGDAPKTLAKSEPVQAQGATPETAARTEATTPQLEQKPVTAQAAKPAVPKASTVQAAKPPDTPEVRPAEPLVSKAQSRPPAAVAVDSPVGKPPLAANIPALRLKPEPEEAERTPPPMDAAARTAEAVPPEAQKAVPPVAEKSAEDATAKLANVPGVKPAIVPQLDARQRVVVPAKPVEREPEKVEDQKVKQAEAKRAEEAKAAAAAAKEAKVPAVPKEAPPPAVTPPKDAVAAKTAEAGATQQKAAESKQKADAAAAASATPPATAAVKTPPAVTATQTETADTNTETMAGRQTPGALPVPRQKAEEPARAPSETGAQQQAAAPEATAKPSGSGTSAKTGGSGSSQTAADALRKASEALSGRLGGLGKGTSGVPSGTSLTGSQLNQGSRLAQACLEQRQVFKFGDKISTTFNVRIDRGQRRLYLPPGNEISSGDNLSGPRLREISLALDQCDGFKKFVLDLPNVTTFNFKFNSGLQ